MRHIFVDFEMNPVDKKYTQERLICKQELIEIGAVMLREDLTEADTFRTYVRPAYGTMQPTVRRITGIRDSMLADAPGYREAIRLFLDWCGEDCRLYAWGPNDLQILKTVEALMPSGDQRLETISDRWEDFQLTFVKLLGLKNRISLKAAVGSANTEFTGKLHDALWDAKNTAALFRLCQNKAEFAARMDSILKALHPEEIPPTTVGEAVEKKNEAKPKPDTAKPRRRRRWHKKTNPGETPKPPENTAQK